jgi:hypothetical protein
VVVAGLAWLRPDLTSISACHSGTLRKTTNDKPDLVEICVGLEISGYLPAEF